MGKCRVVRARRARRFRAEGEFGDLEDGILFKMFGFKFRAITMITFEVVVKLSTTIQKLAF